MARKATGSVYESNHRWYARVWLGNGQRPSVPLPGCASEADATARLTMLADLATKLRAAKDVAPDAARAALERAAVGEGKALDDVRRAIDMISSGEAVLKNPQAPKPTLPSAPAGSPSTSSRPSAQQAQGPTLRELGRLWTSGELAREYPDHIRNKRSAEDDSLRLERYVYPIIGDTLVADLTLDDAEAVMRNLPTGRAAATRRHVAQLLHRLLGIAVFPLRLIPTNPLPRGFLPRIGPGKAKSWLYPSEDARLLASPAVHLCWRMLYGFLNREGPRLSEAAALTWTALDLEHGSITLDENKTDDPRAWALSPGMAQALRAWRILRQAAQGPLSDDSLVFVDEIGQPIGERKHADLFRDHLRAAGIDRAILFERSAARLPIRLHDTRATFITIALANGRTESWVQDRTGHKTSEMINRYRRAARTATELGLGELTPLDQAIPELARVLDPSGGEVAEQVAEVAEQVAEGTAKKIPCAPANDPNPFRYQLSTEGGTRTHKPFRVADFESAAFAIPPLRLGASTVDHRPGGLQPPCAPPSSPVQTTKSSICSRVR